MKKLMSLFLAFAMVLSLVAGGSVSVGAEEEYTYISDVYCSITGRPETLAVGQPLPEVTVGPAHGDTRFTMSCAWLDGEENEIPAGTVTEFGKTYRLRIKAFAVEGYAFTKNAWMGGYYDSRYTVGTRGTGAAEIWGDKDYTAWNAIERAEVTVAEPVAGQPLQMPVAIGENFGIYEANTYWYDNTVQDYVDFGAVAEAGHRYNIYIKLKPAQDYTFTADTQLIFNGQSKSISFDGVQNIDIYGYYDLRITLDSFAFDLADPVVGQPFPQAVVAEDAGYTAKTVWTDQYTDTQMTEDALVAEGGIYDVRVTLTADKLHKVHEDSTLSVNGQNVEKGYSADDYNHRVTYYDTFCLAQPIDKVEVTCAEPEVGQAPGEITLPENVNYYLGEDTYWWNKDDRTDSVEIFESGKDYELNLQICTEVGYAITEDTELYVNGEKIPANKITDYLTELWYCPDYSFKTALDKVELPAWPELKVGDPIPEISGSGEGFCYSVYCYGYDSNGDSISMDVVQEGAAYCMQLSVEAEAGFAFDNNTQITVGGEPSSIAFYGQTESFELEKIYSFGAVTVVDQIDLQVHIPCVGQKGGTVSAPSDAGYTVDEVYWIISPDGTLENAQEKEGTYQAGERILLMVTVSAKSGWWIDSEATFTVNGQEAPVILGAAQKDSAVVFFDFGEPADPPDYNGLVVVDGVWGYYEGGILQEDYTGLVPYGDLIFYVENGILDFSYTGLVWYNDAWRYVANSQLTEGYTGLVWFNDNWFYTVDSVIDWTFTGLVPYEGNYFYVQNNLLDWSYTGLGYHDGGWYFIQNGLLQKEYSGLVYFNDNWFYVEEGVLTYQYFGMVEYEGNLFYVQASHLDWSYTGLGYHEGAWYYFQNALYTPTFSGLVPFNGSLFYVKDGTIDWSFNGEAEYDGTIYTVVNGAVQQ